MLVKLEKHRVVIDSKTLKVYPIIRGNLINVDDSYELNDELGDEWYSSLEEDERQKVALIELGMI